MDNDGIGYMEQPGLKGEDASKIAMKRDIPHARDMTKLILLHVLTSNYYHAIK